MQTFWITNKVNNTTAEILLYGIIGAYDVSALDFVKELRELEKDYANINVRINSIGGDVFEGLAIYNAMRQSKANIETWVDGIAASMASVIAIGGRKCHMSKSARIMTHQPSVGSYGTADAHKENVQILEGIEKTMLAIYSSRTGKKEDECRTMFMNGKDNWFDADQAKAHGLVDDIYDDPATEAPKQTMDQKLVWQMYSKQKFAAVFNDSINNMKQYSLSAASLAAMKLDEKADAAAIDAAINNLVVESAKVPQLTQDLATANTAKKTAEDALVALKSTTAKDEVKRIIAEGLAAKKYTKEFATVLEAQYAEKPVEVKALVDAMKPFESVTDKITDISDVDKTELADLAKMSGEELYEKNKLDRLRELSPEVYAKKYKELFGDEPPAAQK